MDAITPIDVTGANAVVTAVITLVGTIVTLYFNQQLAVLKEKVTHLETENEALKEENVALRGRVDELETENKELHERLYSYLEPKRKNRL